MATLRQLIAAIKPNFSLKELRAMVPWFDAVSDGIDQNGGVIAMAIVDGGGNIQRSVGITAPVSHPSAGNFILAFSETQDVNELYVTANIYSPTTPPAGAINIYPTFPDGDHISVAIWQILAATAVRSQVDEQFIVIVTRAPVST